MKLLGSLVLVSMFALTGCAHGKKSCCKDKSMKSCEGKSCELKKGDKKDSKKKSCCM